MPYKLLLADDSVTIQRVIELTFADEDVKVTAVGDGQQAIDRILSDRPDIVLADVGMPKQDGYEVAAFIKNDPSLQHIPVLLLTGAFEPVDEERAQAVRCNGVLAKPFEPQLLISRVKELLKDVAPETGQAPAEHTDVSIAVASGTDQGPTGEDEVDEVDEDATVRLPRPPTTTLDPETQLEVDALNLRPEPPGTPEGSLDDYFDRLDAAFAHLTGGQPGRDVTTVRPSPASADPWTAAIQTAPAWPAATVNPEHSGGSEERALDPDRRTPFVFGPGPDTGASSTPADDLDAAASLTALPVADAFTSLLDAEREHGPDAVRSARGDGAATVLLPGTVVTQAFLDDVARRVMERFDDPAFRDIVAQVVSATAERLVREEIERIKAANSAP